MRRMLASILLCTARLTAQTNIPTTAVPLEHPVTLQGKVIDFKTGEPIAKALVSIRSQNLKAVTDENGRFELLNVAPGDVELYVSTVDYGLLKQRIELQPGETKELELLLGPENLKHSERITVTAKPFELGQPDAPVRCGIDFPPNKRRRVASGNTLPRAPAGLLGQPEWPHSVSAARPCPGQLSSWQLSRNRVHFAAP